MARKMELKASPFIFTGLKRQDIIIKFLNILNSKFQVSTFVDKLGPRITVGYCWPVPPCMSCAGLKS